MKTTQPLAVLLFTGLVAFQPVYAAEEQEPAFDSVMAQEMFEKLRARLELDGETEITRTQLAELFYYEYSSAKRNGHDPEELVELGDVYAGLITSYAGKQRVLEEVLSFGQQAWGEDAEELVSIYQDIGNNLYFLGDWYGAEKHYKKAISLVKKNKLGNESLARIYGSIGNFLRENSQPDEARSYLRKSQKAVSKLSGDEHVELQARIDYELSYIELMRRKLDKAEDYALEALAKLESIDSQSAIHFRTGLLLANIKHRQGDFDGAINYVFSFARHPEARGDVILKAYPLKTKQPSYLGNRNAYEMFIVRTRFTIDIDGLVKDAEVLDAEDIDPVLAESVLHALEHFRFAPRIVNAKREETTDYVYRFLISNINTINQPEFLWPEEMDSSFLSWDIERLNRL